MLLLYNEALVLTCSTTDNKTFYGLLSTVYSIIARFTAYQTAILFSLEPYDGKQWNINNKQWKITTETNILIHEQTDK